MDRYIYWHAPLWEVLLIILIGLAFVGWLVIRLRRRPDLSVIHPALDLSPLFFYDGIKGLTFLNPAAEQILRDLPAAQRQFLLDVLIETLLEACEESRLTQQPDWPESGHILIAAPISSQPGKVAGVLALVMREAPPPPIPQLAEEHPMSDAENWLTLGRTLQMHRTRPAVRARRVALTAERATPLWQEYPLSHAEHALLRYLAEHPAEVQTAETLFRVVWPDEEVDRYGLRPDQRDRLRRLVYQLRQHVEPTPHNPRYVCTVHGVGYVLYLEGKEGNGETPSVVNPAG